MATSSNSNKVTVIREKVINFENLEKQGINLHQTVKIQEWEKYFILLDGPTYPQLVREFWNNAFIKEKKANTTPVIETRVLGCSITITPTDIAELIRCSEKGIDIEKYRYNSGLEPSIIRKLYDFSGNKTETKSLKPVANLWYKILVSNFMPKEETGLALTIDKHFLYFIMMKQKINLPLTIFNYMKSCIEISRKGNLDFIPYGRVISELLNQRGIVKKARCSRITDYLAKSWGSPLQTVEEREETSSQSYSSYSPCIIGF
ncbi:unnamed protein product [Trifolium pratense]|uniref:Uncharacterized protein n=1 Tax=Trifolium pratense TaxID=57577 RepID=A0ACB0LMD5_TRIPR|nr:unnamed protein product [Trifolium pratense]